MRPEAVVHPDTIPMLELHRVSSPNGEFVVMIVHGSTPDLADAVYANIKGGLDAGRGVKVNNMLIVPDAPASK